MAFPGAGESFNSTAGPGTAANPILLQIGELDGLFLIAGILAGQAAGLRLLNCASDGSQDTLQCLWGIGGLPAGSSQGNLAAAASEAARAHLTERGEPANYLSLLTHIVVSVHQQGLLSSPPGKTLNDHQEELEACLADTDTFVRFNRGLPRIRGCTGCGSL